MLLLCVSDDQIFGCLLAALPRTYRRVSGTKSKEAELLLIYSRDPSGENSDKFTNDSSVCLFFNGWPGSSQELKQTADISICPVPPHLPPSLKVKLAR